ncbi:3-deoxy-D-manno-octulosonic acid kinase [Corallincola holothuriorum]|uniref:3-deoxy-D-manno-octulosonic acid kinase n=1 Tax=Corallincola holothuriorum TaxID=2282215 RepID=A0A368NNS8_9GAMM|nr:3-deoxy-D-manno-octulosonic acid kinase [Corallincola holothuriorum]RCU51760.1 3-deoxy-D-manno-octulosonic acid kinase [Corallincola holothuriorum]
MQHQQDGHHLVFWHSPLNPPPSREWFSANHWRSLDAISGESHGRGVTYFINFQSHCWVLRHYHRGGMIAHISDDQYFYSGLKNTRVWREFQLLQQMHQLGLPVPLPIAGHICRRGLFYRADLIIERIANASDLFQQLQQQALSAKQWQQVGEIIGQFHAAGIYHADLNIHNVLQDNQGRFFLIDFDRGEQRSPAHQWQNDNLMRLLRSCRKEANRVQKWHWQEDDWQLLMQGYRQSNPDFANE